jgi:hypothetical protein
MRPGKAESSCCKDWCYCRHLDQLERQVLKLPNKEIVSTLLDQNIYGCVVSRERHLTLCHIIVTIWQPGIYGTLKMSRNTCFYRDRLVPK